MLGWFGPLVPEQNQRFMAELVDQAAGLRRCVPLQLPKHGKEREKEQCNQLA